MEDNSSAQSPQMPRAWKTEGEGRVKVQQPASDVHPGAGMGRETGCHPGKRQCPAANPAPKKELAYPNTTERNDAENDGGTVCGWRSPQMAEGPRVQVSPFPGQFPTQDYSAAWNLGQLLPSAPTALGDPNKAKLKGPISNSRSKQSPAEVKTHLMLMECSACAQHGTWAPSAEHFILTSLCCH